MGGALALVLAHEAETTLGLENAPRISLALVLVGLPAFLFGAMVASLALILSATMLLGILGTGIVLGVVSASLIRWVDRRNPDAPV